MTVNEKVIITGYTGVCMGHMANFHADVEKRLGRPIFTHEFGVSSFWVEIKEVYKDAFMKLCAEE